MSRTIEERNRLVEKNMGLVYTVARKLSKWAKTRGIKEEDDLVSIGSIGLIHAAATFNELKGYTFSTYAGRCIEYEIIGECYKAGTELKDGVRYVKKPLERLGMREDGLCSQSQPCSLLLEEIRKAVKKIEPEYRRILYMRYWEGKTLYEIGLQLNRTKQRIEQREKVAFQRFKKVYSHEPEDFLLIRPESARLQLPYI
jgi:RNA polymerase sigma factor (sigma-70 family)